MTPTQAIDTYCAAWNETDPARRTELLRSCWHDDAIYTDPTVHTVGLEARVAHIGTVFERYPGSRILRTSAIDTHHGLARFAWRKVLADGTELPDGIDMVEFAADGRLRRIVGFFGPLRAA